MIQGKKIILAVTGSIAAYKACHLLRLLQKAGSIVRVAITDSAAKFVSPLTFSTLSQNEVMLNVWHESTGNQDWSQHVQWAEWADLIIVAPATLNSIGKFANGICHDSVSAIFFSAKSPVLIAPAMDKEMFQHPVNQKNMDYLKQIGIHFVYGESGYLASGLIGEGRMAEPETIFEHAIKCLSPQILSGKKVLINAGPTQENIDPVRFISNHSTGKMGISLAKTAWYFGAETTLVLGPVSTPGNCQFKIEKVQTADEMAQKMFELFKKTDFCICAAAVADFKPAKPAIEKIKKSSENDVPSIELTQNIDILKNLGAKKTHQILIGFALESFNEVFFAKQKLKNKKADGIVLNSIRTEGAAFGHDTNQVSLFWKDDTVQELSLLSKNETAEKIWHWIIQKSN